MDWPVHPPAKGGPRMRSSRFSGGGFEEGDGFSYTSVAGDIKIQLFRRPNGRGRLPREVMGGTPTGQGNKHVQEQPYRKYGFHQAVSSRPPGEAGGISASTAWSACACANPNHAVHCGLRGLRCPKRDTSISGRDGRPF